ncbi:MAG: hypothetical protein EXR79_14950 [Myxococcales bacterium]|nr:hypothetical protein [Myxococcales bacterium]
MRPTAMLLLVSLLASAGCYNTYMVPQDEFRKLQSRAAIAEDGKLEGKITREELTRLQSLGENDAVAVTSERQELVSVNRDTRIYVRSQFGRRYPLTPFNFSMVSSQLVASDRDTLVPLADLKAFEVDHLSTPKTVAMVAVGAVAAAGLIAFIIQTAGQKSYSE